MKKICSLLLLLLFVFGLSSCQKEDSIRTLRIYNWQDYIDDGSMEDDGTSILEDFKTYYLEEYGEEIEVIYDTFETNESMFNTLKTGKTTYDLACPSEYMIMRMIKEDMLEEFDEGLTPTYDEYASKYIQNLFKNTPVSNGKTMANYAKGYMWGTVGLVYDPEYVTEEEMSSWNIMWDQKYKGMVSTKDSIRDTYVAGVMHVYLDELVSLKALHESKTITTSEYNKKINEIMNRCDNETLSLVLDDLQVLKKNLFGFEVDSGKTDIVNGKIRIQLAWSGDAVYSMQLALDEDDKELAYSVPCEGSNIWFDGWAMPKGANKKYAQELMNFLCDPKIASRNMNEVGYTSAIAGKDMWDLVLDWYDEGQSEDTIAYDLTYFFKDTNIEDEQGNKITNFIVYTSEPNRQLFAQYPDEQTIQRCAIMKDFGSQNDKVNEMWIKVKSNKVSWVIYVFLGVIIVGVVFFEVKKAYSRRARKNRNRNRIAH